MKILKKKFVVMVILLFVLPIVSIGLILLRTYGKGMGETAALNAGSALGGPVFYLLLSQILLVILLAILFVFIYKKVLTPLFDACKTVEELRPGRFPVTENVADINGVERLASSIKEIASCLDDSRDAFTVQAAELYNRNWELQGVNSELEASYGQLQATMNQLNDAEQKYHSLIRNIPEVVCVIDNSGVISFINHVCLDAFGYDKSELVGIKFSDLLERPSSGLHIDDIISDLHEGGSKTAELQIVRRDGTVITAEAVFTLYMLNGLNMGLQAIIRDITEKRRMEEEIIKSNKELSMLNSLSRRLTSTLDIDLLSGLVVNEITGQLGMQACLLGLLDDGGAVLRIRAYSGEFYRVVSSVDEFNDMNVSENSFFADIFTSKEIIRADRIPGDTVTYRINAAKPADEKIREFMYVPLRVNDKILGIIFVGSCSSIRHDEESLIASITNNASVAIDNAILYENAKKYFVNTINALIAAVEAKDKYTQGHSQRVAKYAVDIAGRLGLDREQINDIRIAGILHDIGKIGISDNILLKPGRLSEDEYLEVKQHPVISNKILYPVGLSDRILKAVAFHHERYDGAGYPFGLAGADISIEAKIISVADAYDAMTSTRPYRYALSRKEAIDELICNKGVQFDPTIVDAMLEVLGARKTA